VCWWHAELIAKLPVISDEMLATAVHRELCQTTTDWGFAGLLATLRLAWAITIRSLSQYHLATAGLYVLCVNCSIYLRASSNPELGKYRGSVGFCPRVLLAYFSYVLPSIGDARRCLVQH